MPEVRLIVNADDFGLTPGVNRGIIEAHERGIVTSATLMANMPFAQDAIDLAVDHPSLGLGLHINLTSGRPVSSAADLGGLVDRDGRFRGVAGLMVRAWLPSARPALEREIAAQAAKVKGAGVHITHFDSHKHVLVHPVILEAVISAARRYGVGAIRAPVEEKSLCKGAADLRTRSGRSRAAVISLLAERARKILKREGFAVTDYFFGIARTGDWDAASLAAAILNLKPGVTELMVHPGRVDDELRAHRTRLVDSRLAELDALTDGCVRKAVLDAGVRLITFREMEARDG